MFCLLKKTATLACEYFGVKTTLIPGTKNYIANIYTKKTLDYEQISSYAMSLIAVVSKLKSISILEILSAM